ncbi:MAG: tetratricopeptide repeat protein [Ginsengibacter sp.]
MRKSFLLTLLLLISVVKLNAQKELSNPLIDSKDAIAKGVELHDAGKYTAAIAEYLKVAPSDTNYASVLHELILSYYKDSNFVEAERYGNLALALYPHKSGEWYNLLADVYDDTKRSDLALKVYDTILLHNPFNYLAYFNKGISLYRQLRYDEAMVNFQQCIILNPYYSSAHYFLGQLALMKGNMIQALLCFTTDLLVAPENHYQKNTINFLNTVAEVNTTATEYLQKYKPGKEDNFDDIQDILVSKVALDKKYKLKADLEDQIVRQLQVVMEKLEYNANDKGFWMQYYVPLYKNLWDNHYFEPMVFYAFSGLDIKKIKEYNQKEKKKIEAFSNAAVAYLNDVRESHELLFNKRETAHPKYYIKDNIVNGRGSYGKNAKNEAVVTGPWQFFYENGTLKSTGDFDSEGMRNSEWLYYYENGTLKESTFYSHDVANGKSLVFYDNGLPYTTTTYSHDEIEGVQTSYFFSGKLLSIINYKAGVKEGRAAYYNVKGYLATLTGYINGQQDGEQTIYYPNGKISSVVKYAKGNPVGEYNEYFDNGKLKIRGDFTEGKKTGIWNSYFIDGKPDLAENYNNGELDGEWVSYFTNGKIASKRFFRKGDIDGKKEDFDDDGIEYNETIFEKGRLKDIKFFDKKGAVVSNTTSRKGNVAVTFYGPGGVKVSEGNYSKDGLAEGKFTYYYKNGEISADGSYKNDLQEGKKLWYYANKKISEEGNYKNDKADGYFINYYNNGKASDEGWYVDDQRQGTFINYDLAGNITHKIYYLDDRVHGISEYYKPSGKLEHKEYYDNGWFNKVEQYDSTGKITVTSTLNKGEGKVRFNHWNGKPYIESNYTFYELNGVYKVTNGDGSNNRLCYYKDGDLDSVYTSWYPNGKIHIEGKYAHGTKTGTWQYYYYNGQLSESEQYVDGKLDGRDVSYDEHGGTNREYVFKKGQLNGETTYYGDSGHIVLVFYYKDDNILGYSYEDITGKLMPIIPLVNGSGAVDSYYKNGNKSAHMVFNEGLIEGGRMLYSTSGKEQVVGSRVNGLENGSKMIYYPSGKIMKEENYYYGEQHGSFKYYNEDGTLIYNENYYLGSLQGDCKYYTDGRLSQTYTYDNGVLESKK